MSDKITYLVRYYFSKNGIRFVISLPLSKVREIITEEIDYFNMNSWNKKIFMGKKHE